MKPTNYEICLEAVEALATKIDASDEVLLVNRGSAPDGWSVVVGPRAAAELTLLLRA
jgi:hypothetical protein